jgi:hypothetical protein
MHGGPALTEFFNFDRQRCIESFAIRVLRFTNVQLCDNLDGVLEAIAMAPGGRTPLYPPFVRGKSFSARDVGKEISRPRH